MRKWKKTEKKKKIPYLNWLLEALLLNLFQDIIKGQFGEEAMSPVFQSFEEDIQILLLMPLALPLHVLEGLLQDWDTTRTSQAGKKVLDSESAGCFKQM